MLHLYQENKRIMIVLVTLLFLLLSILFFMILQPLLSESKEKNQTVHDVHTSIANMEKELAKIKEEEQIPLEKYKYSTALPTTKKLNELLLTFEKIESISESQITHINFSYDGSLSETVSTGTETEVANEENTEKEQEITEEVEQTESTDESGEIADTEESRSAKEESKEQPMDMQNKPEALQLIQIDLEVVAPDYEHFQAFLKELEKEERFIVMETLQFQKPAEEELVLEENPVEEMVFNMQFMTFYYEE